MDYYCEDKGFPAFLKHAGKVKGVIADNLLVACGHSFSADTRRYIHLIDYVLIRAERLFEYEPATLFQVHLCERREVLFIRIKNAKGEIITLLTVYFSQSSADAKKHSAESLRWSTEAFCYIFKKENKCVP